jgi:hypothetical protein
MRVIVEELDLGEKENIFLSIRKRAQNVTANWNSSSRKSKAQAGKATAMKTDFTHQTQSQDSFRDLLEIARQAPPKISVWTYRNW